MLHHAIPLLLASAACAADLPCPRFASPPAIDGDLAEWKGRPSLSMSTPAVDDLTVEQAGLGWDEAHLYLGVRVADKSLLNLGSGAGIANGDCADLRLNLPDGRLIRLLVSPITEGGGPPALVLGSRADANAATTVLASSNDPKVAAHGVTWAVKTDASGWTVETAIPLALLKLTAAEGSGFPCVLVVWDRDQPDDWKEWHRRSESANQKKPDTWPRLVLAK